MTAPHILIVEDDLDIRDLIQLILTRERFQVSVVSDGETALQRLRSENFDLAVIDWMLPGLSGLDVIRALQERTETRQIPVLMLTARAEHSDVITGLDNGADDYVTKPFDPQVLIARVRALLRRAEMAAESPMEEMVWGELKIYPNRHEVRQGEAPLHLTPYEFKLLLALVEHKGQVLTRERLISLVQGEGISVIDRAIDTHVFGLRKKLGPSAELIETVRGIGYRVKAALT
jgi:two-component system phosphate regulon response regulator PhoB